MIPLDRIRFIGASGAMRGLVTAPSAVRERVVAIRTMSETRSIDR
jgi:hypothetical protein